MLGSVHPLSVAIAATASKKKTCILKKKQLCTNVREKEKKPVDVPDALVLKTRSVSHRFP